MEIDRVDGRTANQLRPLACSRSVLNRAHGSASWSQGKSSSKCSVFIFPFSGAFSTVVLLAYLSFLVLYIYHVWVLSTFFVVVVCFFCSGIVKELPIQSNCFLWVGYVWFLGDTKVLAGVYGPKAGTKKNENPEKTCIEVIWKPNTGQIGELVLYQLYYPTLHLANSLLFELHLAST